MESSKSNSGAEGGVVASTDLPILLSPGAEGFRAAQDETDANGVDLTRMLLVTANVGSIFEDVATMLPLWMDTFLSFVKNLSSQPQFIALHLQEVGGKNYEESMRHVDLFVNLLLSSAVLASYDKVAVFLDEDFGDEAKFTALGCLVLAHSGLERVSIFNFKEKRFQPLEGKLIMAGNIENIAIKEKEKFPLHFFPQLRWSRKGFLRTRWRLRNSTFDLVNIHNFHDASNVESMKSSPSVYSINRRRVLSHVLQRLERDNADGTQPIFLFGDFNCRLDTRNLVKALAEQVQHCETISDRGLETIDYYFQDGARESMLQEQQELRHLAKDEENLKRKVFLTVGKKVFDHRESHDLCFSTKKLPWLQTFDDELKFFKEKLDEFPINFPPTYPYYENLENGTSYMRTRCPAWCDRILFNREALRLVLHEDDDELLFPVYDVIGADVCMGDHKPVFLDFYLRHEGDPTLTGASFSGAFPLGAISLPRPLPEFEVDEKVAPADKRPTQRTRGDLVCPFARGFDESGERRRVDARDFGVLPTNEALKTGDSETQPHLLQKMRNLQQPQFKSPDTTRTSLMRSHGSAPSFRFCDYEKEIQNILHLSFCKFAVTSCNSGIHVFGSTDRSCCY